MAATGEGHGLTNGLIQGSQLSAASLTWTPSLSSALVLQVVLIGGQKPALGERIREWVRGPIILYMRLYVK